MKFLLENLLNWPLAWKYKKINCIRSVLLSHKCSAKFRDIIFSNILHFLKLEVQTVVRYLIKKSNSRLYLFVWVNVIDTTLHLKIHINSHIFIAWWWRRGYHIVIKCERCGHKDYNHMSKFMKISLTRLGLSYIHAMCIPYVNVVNIRNVCIFIYHF